jgi:hypothetical protein
VLISAEDYEVLIAGILRYRAEKGFEPCTWETAAPRICCLAAEIWEVEEALSLTAWSKVEAANELAGVACYILGLQHDLGFVLGTQRSQLNEALSQHASPADLTAVLRKYWRMTFEAWRREDRKDTPICLELLFCAVLHVRDHVLDLPGTLQADMISMLRPNDRPWRHGGKNPLT